MQRWIPTPTLLFTVTMIVSCEGKPNNVAGQHHSLNRCLTCLNILERWLPVCFPCQFAIALRNRSKIQIPSRTVVKPTQMPLGYRISICYMPLTYMLKNEIMVTRPLIASWASYHQWVNWHPARQYPSCVKLGCTQHPTSHGYYGTWTWYLGSCAKVFTSSATHARYQHDNITIIK